MIDQFASQISIAADKHILCKDLTSTRSLESFCCKWRAVTSDESNNSVHKLQAGREAKIVHNNLKAVGLNYGN